MQVIERILSEEAPIAEQARLSVYVVYTSMAATRAALGAASRLTIARDARIRVILLRVIPFPLPLDNPPISARFDQERILASLNNGSDDASLLICYCRDQLEALLRLLKSHLQPFGSNSVIVIAGKKRRWFPTSEQRLAGRLEEAGHRVVFVDMGGSDA
jgi:hypothetical protein